MPSDNGRTDVARGECQARIQDAALEVRGSQWGDLPIDIAKHRLTLSESLKSRAASHTGTDANGACLGDSLRFARNHFVVQEQVL